MSISKLLAGTAGFGLLALGGVALVPTQAAAECSGLGCIFGNRDAAPQPQQTPQEAQAIRDSDKAARADAAADTVAPGGAKTAADATTAAPKKVAKPVHVVTITADAPEMGRLKSLAAALPKEKIKIVTAKADGAAPRTDFTVSTTLEQSHGDEGAKLFTEQMHIVAGGGIHSVADLRGKVVSFGPEKSPGQMAARKAFEALDVKVQETPLEIDNALDGLSTGDVAAVVMLAPQPIARLKSVTAPGLHLVSWPESGTLPEGAVAATIDPAAYPGLARSGETIRAMGVDATLVMSAKGAKDGAAKTFLKALSDHSATLSKRGFDLLKADLDSRKARHLASADHS